MKLKIGTKLKGIADRPMMGLSIEKNVFYTRKNRIYTIIDLDATHFFIVSDWSDHHGCPIKILSNYFEVCNIKLNKNIAIL